MTSFSRCAILAALACALAVCVRYAAPSLATDLGLDVWSVTEIQGQMQKDRARFEELDQQGEAVRRRIAVKAALAADLIAGRATLWEVAARFRDLNTARPDYPEFIRRSYRGASDEERQCRNVIEHVEALMDAAGPSLRREMVAQLERELQERLDRDGRIDLP